ncbi:DUF4360 domain-containing protein [Actinomadura roseirufa]|uniref:DUF4360 domain-containing protein n=1 Tax=Actinomadura roseirufa TaxID=2094049 RepID=UPI001F5F553D|nr:DUF4360 domain-containing protein [Actinomadura roseirufa]
MTIEIATVNGSGCPMGAAAVEVSDDRDAFAISYSQYAAQAGGGSKPADHRKNCHLNLKVHAPRGFTYAVSSADHRGYASLQPGAEAILLSRFYFQGASQVREFTHRLLGPYDGAWRFTDVVPESELVWKPCGEERNLNVETRLQMNEGTSDPAKVSFIGASAPDGSVKTTYHLSWMTCPTSRSE